MTATLPTLGQGRELVAPALRTVVDRLDPHTRLVVAYHLGWCDAHGQAVNSNGGKSIRPALALIGARAAGGSAIEAVPGAVAVELVHNFSLVHDDLMDRDIERRHRPTVWALWGDATAVLAGDAMLSLAHEALVDAGTIRCRAAAAAITVATRELIRGQAADLEFERRNDVSLTECFDMAEGKTGALLGTSAAIGAILCGASSRIVAALDEYGRQVGLAFQLIDDVLGIWGRPQVTGKPVHSDLRSRKKTLPITWAIEHGGAPGRNLATWLRDDGHAGDENLLAAADLVEAAGGREWAGAEARRHMDLARAALDRVDLRAQPRAELDELADFIVDREA